MADTKIVVDCSTGASRVERLTEKEKRQRDEDVAEHVKREKEIAAAVERKQAVLAKVAEAAGVSVEELRDSLR